MRAQQPFTGLGISLKAIGLAVIFFLMKYVFMAVFIVAAFLGICFFVKEMINNK